MRLLPFLRFPAIILVLVGMLIGIETGLSHVAASINQRLFFSGRLEETARFETEANRFFETAELFAQAEDGISIDDVNLALNLFWSRAKVMDTPSFHEALPADQPDPGLVSEIVADLPKFEQAVGVLRKGDTASYRAIDDFRRKYSRRLAALGQLAWNERQLRVAQSVESGLRAVSDLRWIQTGFGIASVLAMLYVLVELILSRRVNAQLNRAVKEKQRMLRSDMLTGISNRFHFEEELAQRFRSDARDFTIVYFDLDGFKQVNDEHGHAAGDVLLKYVADCLRRQMADGDVAARFGGDEFAVIVEGDLEKAKGFTARVLTAVCQPVIDDMPKLNVSASAGLSHAAELNGAGAPDLLKRRADLALYAAKAAGRNCQRVFTPEMMGEFERRRVLEGDIQSAIDRGELTLDFQPILRLSDRRPMFIEALVRWPHQAMGSVPAMETVAVAERAQLIQPLTLLVLRQALSARRRLGEKHLKLPVSINIAPSLLAMPTFGPSVAALLHEFRLEAGQLYLEMTEDGELRDSDVIENNLRILRLAGVHMIVDDFGRAFANVSRLTSLDFKMLKLDQSLAASVATSERARQIVESTDRMALALGAETICEGIESEAQLRALIEIGIPYGQGFHLAAPMPIADLESFLKDTMLADDIKS